jgi:cholesterol transport system auxiliary component
MMHVTFGRVLTRRAVLLGTAALSVSGCAFLSKPPVPQLYILRPQVTAPMGMPVRWRLSVAVPDAISSLDTPRIALSRSPITMDYFASAAWTDRVPLLLQRTLVQSFDTSGRIISVGRDTSGFESDYLLETEIRDFQARYDSPSGPPEVVVVIQVKLVRMPEREIVGGMLANQRATAVSNSMDSVVGAFNQAAGGALSQIVGWTLNQPGPA